MHAITQLKNEELLLKTKQLTQLERDIQIELLHHLREIEKRRLFLDIGFGSLFDYVVQELHYSESAAYRRIQAMRLIRDLPEIEEKIAVGQLSLTVAAQAQCFFKNSTVNSKLHLEKENKLEILKDLENKSSREVEKHLLSLNPEILPAKEKVKQLTETQVELKIVVSDGLKQKLDQLKLLLSHVKPNMTYSELLEYLSDKALKKLDPVQKVAKPLPAPEVEVASPKDQVKQTTKEVSKMSPYRPAIPAALRRAIWLRDQGCCTFTDAKTQKCCGSRFQVQVDHIQPVALGGKDEPENLRLLCANHNRRRAEKTFGKRDPNI